MPLTNEHMEDMTVAELVDLLKENDLCQLDIGHVHVVLTGEYPRCIPIAWRDECPNGHKLWRVEGHHFCGRCGTRLEDEHGR